MINLLFISNSPQAELLRAYFQQILKIRIEVVEDFDRGLKDVFEKRPVVVCIQEQIAGVTGESVARHIQLLLGTGAPGFILMHEGSAKAKVVAGLFNQLIDLSAPFETVCQTLHLALQSQLGDRWDKVYTPPPQEESGPEVQKTDSFTDQLINEFIAENSIFNPQNALPLPNLETSTADEDFFLHDLPGGPPAEPQSAVTHQPEVRLGPVDVASPPVPENPLPMQKTMPQVQKQKTEHPETPLQQVPVLPPAAAVKQIPSEEASMPVDELLQAFEENYRSSKRLKVRIVFAVVILLVVLVLVWALLQERSKKLSSVTVQQQPAMTSLQKPVSSVQTPIRADQTAVSKPDSVPSFIPVSGLDADFSRNKPGWSRYLSKQRDYRLFKVEGRLSALQVLVVGNDNIAPAELKLALRELTGTDQYRTDSQESRRTLRLERATVPGRAELLIYRSTSRGPIKAFVLQLTL